MDIQYLKKNLLSRQPDAECEDTLVSLVTSPEATPSVKEARDFFVDGFSARFLDNIARNICRLERADILGEYYEFISADGGATPTPYYKVSLYKRKNDSRLDTYVARITARHFTDAQKKHTRYLSSHTPFDSFRTEINADDDFSKDEVTDNSWFALLIADEDFSFFSANNIETITKLNIALSQLDDRDRLVIQLVELNDVPLIEAFDELLPYMSFKKPVKTLTRKDRQDAVSRLNNRALERLAKKINALL
ncbi:MAG: hypothetical protein NC241_03360 [Bacteroides sp.]|nr:hypothetical protein [Bacteroides sp.]MCM1457073.1 hypothetical protein [Lachnoclostridium sp.]